MEHLCNGSVDLLASQAALWNVNCKMCEKKYLEKKNIYILASLVDICRINETRESGIGFP